MLTEFDQTMIANMTAALDFICKKIPANKRQQRTAQAHWGRVGPVRAHGWTFADRPSTSRDESYRGDRDADPVQLVHMEVALECLSTLLLPSP
jgi:hypothetical protein